MTYHVIVALLLASFGTILILVGIILLLLNGAAS